MSHILVPHAHSPLLPLHTPAVPIRRHASSIALDMAKTPARSPPQASPAPSGPPSPSALPAASPMLSHAPFRPASKMAQPPQMHVPELGPHGIDLEAHMQAGWPSWAQLSEPIGASLLGAGVPALGGVVAYSATAGLQAVCQSGICGPAAGLNGAALGMGALSGGLVTVWTYRAGTHRVQVQAVSVRAAWASAVAATAVDIGMSFAMGRPTNFSDTACYLPVLFRSAGSTAALLSFADAYLGAPPAALYNLGHSATWPVALGYKMARHFVRSAWRRRWH